MYSFDNVNEKLKSTAILTKLSKSTHKAVIHCLVACYLLIDQANQTSQQSTLSFNSYFISRWGLAKLPYFRVIINVNVCIANQCFNF